MDHPIAPPPPHTVVAAFGGRGTPQLLRGGENRSYRCGPVVLKVADEDERTEEMLAFEATVPESPDFRFPRPVRAASGRWVHEGWCARIWVEGREEPGRFAERIRTCRAFHAAIAEAPRPAFLDTEDPNPWQVADEITWGERAWTPHPKVAPLVTGLQAILRPVRAPAQLIHGDFGGNLVYADGLPPAVLDFSPYWRPAGFALGVVVADAIVWDGADEDLIDTVTDVDEWLQLLARAELRRVLECDTHTASGRDMLAEVDAHAPLVQAICRRCAR